MMRTYLRLLISLFRTVLRSRANLVAENLLLRKRTACKVIASHARAPTADSVKTPSTPFGGWLLAIFGWLRTSRGTGSLRKPAQRSLDNHARKYTLSTLT